MKCIRNLSCWQSFLNQGNTHTIRCQSDEAPFHCTWGLGICDSDTKTNTGFLTFSFVSMDNASLVWDGWRGMNDLAFNGLWQFFEVEV